VDQLYPSLLALNQDLHFRLKVRQFIEMVSGADSLDTDNDTSTSSANSSSIMDTEDTDNSPAAVNGSSSNNTSNGNIEADADNNTTDTMEVEAETVANRDNSIMSNPAKFECLIRFGRRLHVFHEKLEQEKGRNTSNTQMLQDAFSLLAYPDPWNSSVGGQLDPSGREPVCAQLNSAILESKQLATRPPLEVSVAHTSQLLQLMSHNDLGACAFTNMETLLN